MLCVANGGKDELLQVHCTAMSIESPAYFFAKVLLFVTDKGFLAFALLSGPCTAAQVSSAVFQVTYSFDGWTADVCCKTVTRLSLNGQE